MFDDLIKSKANEHEAPVPPDAWGNIVKKKRRRRTAFWWWGSSAILLIGLSVAGYFFIIPQQPGNRATAQHENKTPGLLSNDNETAVQPVIRSGTGEGRQLAVTEKQTNDAANYATVESSTDNQFTKRSQIIHNKPKVTTDITPGLVDGGETGFYNSRKKTTKTKGRIITEQINPAIGDVIFEKAGNNLHTTEENNKEDKEPGYVNEVEISNDMVTADKRIPLTPKEEQKTTEPTGIKEPVKKETTAVKKHTAKKGWHIEAAAMPLLVSTSNNNNVSFKREFTSGNSTILYNGILLKTSIEPAVAFSVNIRRDVGKKLSIGTGMQFVQLKENLQIEGKETNITYSPVQRLVSGQLIADTVVTVSEGTRSIKAVNSYRLISIPVFTQYNIVQKPRWSLGLVGGAYINISSSYQNEIDRNAAAPLTGISVSTNSTGLDADVFAGVRLGKTLRKSVEFFVMPSMRWNIGKYKIKNSLLNSNINQAGFAFGMCYTFN